MTRRVRMSLGFMMVLCGGVSVWAVPNVGAQSSVPDAPAVSSASPTLTSVTVAWTAPSSNGGSAVTAYDLRHIRSDATDKSDSQWTEQHDVWVSGGGALSHRQTGLTPSVGYDIQVRAVNATGDGAWSATRTSTTLTPAISGTPTLSYAENSATRVATFSVTGADPEVDEITWAISGPDANHFDISTPMGALRLIDTSDTAVGLKRPKQPDYESPDDSGADGSYSITLTATVGGVDSTLAVTATVTDVDEPGAVTLSPVRPKAGAAVTATLSDPDTASGSTAWVWQRSSGRNSWTTISGATGASYTPVAADSGQYLRARATYTDGHGSGKRAVATAHHVVIASVLTGLSVSTTDSTLALTPGFAEDVLHYKISCAATDTMTVTPTAAAGVRLAVDGTQTASGTSVNVAVTKDSDVVVRASGADGGFTDYVVHCVGDWLATMEALDRGRGGVTESLISFVLDGYLAVIDHHGVPRFRRRPAATPVFWLRHYRVGSSGEYRWHYTTRAAGCASSHHVLDEDFASLATVSSKSPLRCGGVHDFRILDNGGYLLMSYEPTVDRDLSDVVLHESLLQNRVWGRIDRSWRTTQFTASEALSDSAIQILTPSQGVSRTWRSWGTMAYDDCVQHWWDEWAHVNMVQYFEGNVIGSFRGCSKVLSIDASTGRVEWRLGRSNLSAQEWAARNIGPAPLRIIGDPEGEFCGQHGAEMHVDGQDGRLTLYDNGEACLIELATGETERTSDEYSRAVEYALDLANGEAVFLRDHSLHGARDRAGTRGGHVEVLDDGDWLIGWGRERQPHLQSTKLSPDEAITQVDPRTGTEKLSLKIPASSTSSFQANVRPTTVPAYVLAPQPEALTVSFPPSTRTSTSHSGPQSSVSIVIAFSHPVADFDADSPSLGVSGATISNVTPLVAAGEAANAYEVNLTPTGQGTATLRFWTARTCASGGICTADGSRLAVASALIAVCNSSAQQSNCGVRTIPRVFGGGPSGGGGPVGADDASTGFCADGSVIVVANGWSPADIGTASVFAARAADAAVLYSPADGLPTDVGRLLGRCAPGRIVLVGGAQALGRDVVSGARAAADGVDIDRISGATRVDTAAAAARQVLQAAGSSASRTVVVVNGWSPPDIGAAASLAARIPASAVAYVSSTGLPEATRALVARYQPARILVVGGPSVVTPAIVGDLAVAAPNASIERIVGMDRAETAVNAVRRASLASGSSTRTLMVVNGWSPPDIGAAASLAARSPDSAVAYVSRTSLPETTRDLIAELRPARIVIVGGVAAVSPDLAAAISAASPGTIVDRISGADRITTALSAARRALDDPDL